MESISTATGPEGAVPNDLEDDGFFLGLGPTPAIGFTLEAKTEAKPAEAAPPAEEPISTALPEEDESLGTISAQIPDKTYFRIGDVSDLAGVKPYVLRYWETEFPMINPEKSSTGQRVYRRVDVEAILLIKHLLYKEKYSIEGARKRLQELKREGQLKAFKHDKIYGGQQAAILQERMKQIRTIARELNDLVHLPLRELFKY